MTIFKEGAMSISLKLDVCCIFFKGLRSGDLLNQIRADQSGGVLFQGQNMNSFSLLASVTHCIVK
jgi:hypothetical protein